jgi:hypothetical protein
MVSSYIESRMASMLKTILVFSKISKTAAGRSCAHHLQSKKCHIRLGSCYKPMKFTILGDYIMRNRLPRVLRPWGEKIPEIIGSEICRRITTRHECTCISENAIKFVVYVVILRNSRHKHIAIREF